MLKVIFLTVSLFLTSCALKPMPVNYLHVMDTKHNVCARYKIIDKKTLEVDPKGEDMPLDFCDGFVAIDYKEYKDFQSWLKDVIEKASGKAGRAKLEVQSEDLKQDFQEIEKLGMP